MKASALFVALVAVVAVVSAMVIPEAAAAEPQVDALVVGPADEGGIYVLSPRRARVGFFTTKGSRLLVRVDGVDGPLFDELFDARGATCAVPGQMTVVPGGMGGQNAQNLIPLIFSPDGAHYAYAGRQGNDYVVIHDGKEIGRGPRPFLALNYGPLTISPGGQFVHWGEMQPLGASSSGNWRLIINGKAGPWGSHVGWDPVFSPDDTRFAYNLTSLADREKRSLIIDGKVASYAGHSPIFTADSKALLTVAGEALLVDGKPSGASGLSIEAITVAPVGRRFAVIMRKKIVNAQSVGTLFLDGKEVPGTEGAKSISFSPDGKRYALSCINPEARSGFMIVDGKKGNEYQSVADSASVAWTPDSVKVIYTATSAGRQFVIVDGQEFSVPGLSLHGKSPVALPAKGNRYAFSTYDGSNRNFTVVVDGQQILPPGLWPKASTLTFSTDGTRHAFVANPVGRNEIAGIVVDGTLIDNLVVGAFNAPGANALNAPSSQMRNPYFQFSPDGKYLARMARRPDNSQAGIYINNQMAFSTPYQVSNATISPDSQHLYWLGHEKFPDRAPFYFVAYVDGQPVAKLSGDPFQTSPGAWEVGSGGVLTFFGVVGSDVKRFRVTPATDMNIEKMITATAAKEAKAAADAVAAKQKADDDAAAVAAKKQADAAAGAAKRKADQDAAVAKRKADIEAATAAKAKARADAAAAKAAARKKQ